MLKEVKIDIDAAGGVALDRLGRSLLLHGERVGDGRYHVTGGEHDHWVDLYTTTHPRCDCGDHLWRGTDFKHIFPAPLRAGDDPVRGGARRPLSPGPNDTPPQSAQPPRARRHPPRRPA